MTDIPPKYRHDFALLETAILGRARCPTNPEFRESGAIVALARLGAVTSEVFAHNFRRVTILIGPHAGKSTADPPEHYGPPYKVIGGRKVSA